MNKFHFGCGLLFCLTGLAFMIMSAILESSFMLIGAIILIILGSGLIPMSFEEEEQ